MAAPYGTFTNPHVVDLETEEDWGSKDATTTTTTTTHQNTVLKGDDANDDGFEPRVCDCACSDCCAVMALLCAPGRLQTYKLLLFHVVNAALALVGTALTLAIAAMRLATVCWDHAAAGRFQRHTLLALVRTDAALLNFVATRDERVHVTSSLSASDSVAPLLVYFGGVKFACCALPGAVAAAAFVSSVQRLVAVAFCVAASGGRSSACDDALVGDHLLLDWLPTARSGGGGESVRHFLATAAQDRDGLVLLALLGVYGATLLVQIAAYVGRHVALYCCSDHLRYVVARGDRRGVKCADGLGPA